MSRLDARLQVPARSAGQRCRAGRPLSLAGWLQLALAEWSRAADAEQRYRKLRHQGAFSAHRDVARRVFDELYGRCRGTDVPPE